MTEREYSIMKVHRERVRDAKNFEQFKEAQLLLLDWLIDEYESQEEAAAKVDNKFMSPES